MLTYGLSPEAVQLMHFFQIRSTEDCPRDKVIIVLQTSHIHISIALISTNIIFLVKFVNAVTLLSTTSKNELYCALALSADWLDILLTLTNRCNKIEK